MSSGAEIAAILLIWSSVSFFSGGEPADQQAVLTVTSFNFGKLRRGKRFDSKGKEFLANYENGMRYFRNRLRINLPLLRDV